jgi:hypothetical protein
MPTRIVNVHPGSGSRNDQIQIEVEFDPPSGGGTPDVAAVVFNSADAPQYNLTDRDFENHTLTLRVKVPATATTGCIEVDLRAPAGSGTTYDPVRTVKDFTVEDSDDHTFRITNVFPATPPGGFNHGDQLRIVTYPAPSQSNTVTAVYFPNSDNGPAILRATTPPIQIRGNTIYVTIPAQAETGRVKVVNGQGPQTPSALTRVLTIA